ncbi:MAG: DUF58 domain-containing protein [Defluviitaleaceae bacterium]|nr:DUF58 domain-containing protein [Defluviitaleaceae bacterium]
MSALGVFLALLLVLLFIKKVYSLYCLSNVDVSLSISAATATEGDKLILTEVVTNRKWLPLPWLAVKFQVDRELVFADKGAAAISDFYYRNDLFHVLMHQKITRRLGFTCTKRGFYVIHGLEVTGWDILMEHKYIRQFENETQLIVYPRTFETDELNALCTRIYGQLRTIYPINQDPFSFRGVREYSPHDPMKSINFKASAKTTELMVNVWDFSNARQIVFLLDAERHSAWHDENTEERAVKIIASLAEKFTAQGVPMSFITNGLLTPRPGTHQHGEIPEGRGEAHLRKILEALAFVDFNLSETNVIPLSEIICRLGGVIPENNPEYIIVSPYYSKAVASACSTLKESGERCTWVIPGEKPKDFDYAEEIIFI